VSLTPPGPGSSCALRTFVPQLCRAAGFVARLPPAPLCPPLRCLRVSFASSLPPAPVVLTTPCSRPRHPRLSRPRCAQLYRARRFRCGPSTLPASRCVRLRPSTRAPSRPLPLAPPSLPPPSLPQRPLSPCPPRPRARRRATLAVRTPAVSARAVPTPGGRFHARCFHSRRPHSRRAITVCPPPPCPAGCPLSAAPSPSRPTLNRVGPCAQPPLGVLPPPSPAHRRHLAVTCCPARRPRPPTHALPTRL
jgi:hypothetical protein